MATEIDRNGVMPGAILGLADFRSARVLEVGAGDGRLTRQYAAEAKSVVAIDIKEADIRSAAKNLRTDYLGIHFLCADATALPFSAEAFEIVLQASSL